MTESEYKQVFEVYRMYVFYFCKKLINNKEEAEDITFITFMKLWANKENIPMDKSKAFLLVTANHKCQDYIKVNGRYKSALSSFSISDMDEVKIDTEVLTYLSKLINTLGPQEKKMILLKYEDGKEVKAISKLLGLSPQTVSNTLNNALKKLRDKIKNKAQ